MTNKRERFPQGDTDRVSFTLAPGVRQRVDKVLPILSSSLSKTLRYLIDLGLDLFDLAQKMEVQFLKQVVWIECFLPILL